LGTALQHSVPIGRRYANPLDPSTKFIDPVERYMDYEYQPRNMNRLIKTLDWLGFTYVLRFHPRNINRLIKTLDWLRFTYVCGD
jgi:hypothetical protein